MIAGVVKNKYATVAVVFHLPNRPDFSIDFVIDTGFTDHLCLPAEAVALLGLPFKYAMSANLADNSDVILPIHEAVIFWNGSERKVRVLATGRKPLLGTGLLEECELVVQFTEGGLVAIEQLR
jgi:clan AA aspartic protease